MKISLEKAIKATYDHWALTADQIVQDPDASLKFTEQVKSRLPQSEAVEIEVLDVTKALLNLRRRGEKKGGLPRRTLQ